MKHKPDMYFEPHKPFCMFAELYTVKGFLRRFMRMGIMLLMLVKVLVQILVNLFELKSNFLNWNRLVNREGTNEVKLLLLK